MRHEVVIGLLVPVGGLALVVGSVFLAWLFILAAPIVFTVGLFMFLCSRVRLPKAVRAVEAKAPEQARDNLEILCIKGLRTEQVLLERFRTGLAELWAQAPDEDAVACSCVRRHGEDYSGILRMRSKQGHSYARVAGRSIRDIGERYLEQLDSYKRNFPIVMTETPFENSECNRQRCHLKEKSIFHNGKSLVA
ncbi:MAG: hypothetical protein ACYTFN_13890 [Planctomycetota bacterium]